MSCGINNPVMVVYDISGSGIKMPSRYNENDLVGDMLKMILNEDTKMMEVPVDSSIADESTVYDEDAEPTDTPLVSVIPDEISTTPAPISLPSTTSIEAPTIEITTSMITPSSETTPNIPTTIAPETTPNITTTIAPETTPNIPTTTSIATETTSSGAVEYFTNKLKCTEKKNYLIFGIIITIFLLVIILVLQKANNKL